MAEAEAAEEEAGVEEEAARPCAAALEVAEAAARAAAKAAAAAQAAAGKAVVVAAVLPYLSLVECCARPSTLLQRCRHHHWSRQRYERQSSTCRHQVAPAYPATACSPRTSHPQWPPPLARGEMMIAETAAFSSATSA